MTDSNPDSDPPQVLVRFASLKKIGNGKWSARCPAHKDRNPSLSITQTENKFLIHCHAQCSIESVLAAVGLTAADLFLMPRQIAKRQAVKTSYYQYQNDNRVKRLDYANGDKTFVAEHKNGSGWVKGWKGPRTLYRRAEVLIADTVIVNEGERVADLCAALVNSIEGWASTSAPFGAGKFTEEQARDLAGKHVVIIADNDEPGHRHAQGVANKAAQVALSVKVLTVSEKPKGDVEQFIEAGGNLEKLLRLIEAAPAWTPDSVEVAGPNKWLVHCSEFRPMNHSGDIISGLIRLNAISQIFGPSGVGKSTLAVDLGFHVARAGLPVIYATSEAEDEIEAREMALHYHYQEPANGFPFYRYPRIPAEDSDEPIPVLNLLSSLCISELIGIIKAVQARLLIIDCLAPTMAGGNESGTDDMAVVVANLNMIRRKTGAAILVLHHTGWNSTRERGSSALRATCRIVGKLEITDDDLLVLSCQKTNSKPFENYYFRIIEVAGEPVIVRASRVVEDPAKLTANQYRVLDMLGLRKQRQGATFTAIRDHTGLAKSSVNKTLSSLIDRNLVIQSGEKYRISESGKVAADAYHRTRNRGEKQVNLEVNWIVENSRRSSSPESASNSPVSLLSMSEFTASSGSVHLENYTSSPAPPFKGAQVVNSANSQEEKLPEWVTENSGEPENGFYE